MENPDLGTCSKSNRLIVSPSYQAGAFDSHAVDCPFVFRHGDEYRMTFVGWDSTGYRTGWARSTDVRSWEKMGLLIDRGPAGSHTEYNVALTSIMRENGLYGAGELRQVDGRFVGTYHSYPDPGYEADPDTFQIDSWEGAELDEVVEPARPPRSPGWPGAGSFGWMLSWLLIGLGSRYFFWGSGS